MSSKAGAASFGFDRGRDPTRYYLRVFGTPGAETWSWRFGGHHISIHHTIVDGRGARVHTMLLRCGSLRRAPLLGPHPLRPLAGCEDFAFELLRSLSEEQRSVAVLSPGTADRSGRAPIAPCSATETSPGA